MGGKGKCLKKWGDSPNLEGWIAKDQVYFSTLIWSPSRKLQLIKGRFPQHRQNVSSNPTRVTRKGATASRLGKEETSQEEEAAAPLLAPSTGRRSCATGAPAPRAPPPPRPSPYARLRSPRPFKVPPEVQLRLRFLLPPDPSQLSSTESSRPERGLFRTTGGQWRQQGWASPSQAHSTPPRPGPGGARLRDGEGSSLPYLRHICRTDGSHLRGGRSWVTARTRM